MDGCLQCNSTTVTKNVIHCGKLRGRFHNSAVENLPSLQRPAGRPNELFSTYSTGSENY
ncbi:hypothetical protein Mapa_002794 [Marchantia paleacea]|nr:hypothetical protein Mapa_002794 [Marchantia paleacea]